MPENKRIAGTGLIPGDEFMLEGVLVYAQTKRPRQNNFNPLNFEFPITIQQDPAHPIQVQVPQNLDPATQARIKAGAERYIQNALKIDKNDPTGNTGRIYLSKNARFTTTPNFQDFNDVAAKLDPRSLIPTLIDTDNGYEIYEGNDPATDSNPVSKVIINIYEYKQGVNQGVTDGIQYILYPKDMVPFAGGGGVKNAIEKYGERFHGETKAQSTGQPAPAAVNNYAAPAANSYTAPVQPQPAPTVDPAPAFNPNQPAFGNPTQPNNASPFGASPFASAQDSPFGQA